MDSVGKVLYLFNDGTLKALNASDKVQSRVQLEFFESNKAAFVNVNKKYLNSATMTWDSEIQELEISEDQLNKNMVYFKNSDGSYLTSGEVISFSSSFNNTDQPASDQLFEITRHCIRGMRYKYLHSNSFFIARS